EHNYHGNERFHEERWHIQHERSRHWNLQLRQRFRGDGNRADRYRHGNCSAAAESCVCVDGTLNEVNGANCCLPLEARQGPRSELAQPSLARGHGALSLPAAVIAQSDIHEHAAARSFDADDKSFGILAAFGSVFSVEDGRMHTEMEPLIIERSDGIAGYFVSQLADGFAHQSV